MLHDGKRGDVRAPPVPLTLYVTSTRHVINTKGSRSQPIYYIITPAYTCASLAWQRRSTHRNTSNCVLTDKIGHRIWQCMCLIELLSYTAIFAVICRDTGLCGVWESLPCEIRGMMMKLSHAWLKFWFIYFFRSLFPFVWHDDGWIYYYAGRRNNFIIIFYFPRNLNTYTHTTHVVTTAALLSTSFIVDFFFFFFCFLFFNAREPR